MHGLIDAGDWVTRTLDTQGYRVDDVKGMAVEFVRTWLTSKSMASRFAVGEYFDGNSQTLNWWVWQSGMMGRCNLFDFSLRFLLAAMCNNNSRWDMSQLDHAGLAGISPANAVTFVDNPDTDLSFPVIRNKTLGYAYILTSEGYPCVYYKDYSSDPGCYGLKPALDNLIWIHENLAFGSTAVRFKDFQAIVYEREGFPGLLVGLNNDQYNGWRTVTVQTSFGPNVDLHDYTGHAGDVRTDGGGAVTIGIPPNSNGGGYVAYSRSGFGRPFAVVTYRTTQTFFAASDLDIGPVTNAAPREVGRIWCAAQSTVQARLNVEAGHWAAATELTFELLDAQGAPVLTRRWTAAAPTPGIAQGTVHEGGWHMARLTAGGLAPPGEMPFELTLTYSAPQRLE
jgi:alpha-amylase